MDSYRYVVSDLFWYEILVQYHVNEYRVTRGNQYEKNTHLVFLRGSVEKEETYSICPKIKTVSFVHYCRIFQIISTNSNSIVLPLE